MPTTATLSHTHRTKGSGGRWTLSSQRGQVTPHCPGRCPLLWPGPSCCPPQHRTARLRPQGTPAALHSCRRFPGPGSMLWATDPDTGQAFRPQGKGDPKKGKRLCKGAGWGRAWPARGTSKSSAWPGPRGHVEVTSGGVRGGQISALQPSKGVRAMQGGLRDQPNEVLPLNTSHWM